MDQLDNIQNLIYVIRGQRVMLDFDLARLYQVETKALNQAVKRNPKRFEGEEFMFQLTKEEWRTVKVQIFHVQSSDIEAVPNLQSQIVTAKSIKKQRFQPYAFSEIGVAMLSSVLKSEVAIQANRKIMKTFVAYRHLAELPLAATYLDLRKQIEGFSRRDRCLGMAHVPMTIISDCCDNDLNVTLDAYFMIFAGLHLSGTS